ncbi:E3 ubiquitin-protein ligase RNF146-B-like isoform X1 [Megalopta genalis]|uniref:E3 ubiquitin-protein ligase RNF146-B-like isoform X1 n=1 Tax=Megalopta genalis TaxID=115081 RepID=UPI003FD4121C
MAQANLNSQDGAGSTLKDKETESDEKEGSTIIPECTDCLRPCLYPTKLPCNHVYCYLCVKGVANQSAYRKRCPKCRQVIPPEFLDRPQRLVEIEDTHKELHSSEKEYHWFFEGTTGWWKYHSKINEDLERIYNLGKAGCEMSICGQLYIFNFRKHCQHRKYSPDNKIYMKRDRIDAPCTGVGFRTWKGFYDPYYK